MTRLIDADELLETLDSYEITKWYHGDLETIILYSPTVDAEPVRHGKWIPIIERPTRWCAFHKLAGHQCSLCGRIEKKNEPYCNCGAKMDVI